MSWLLSSFVLLFSFTARAEPPRLEEVGLTAEQQAFVRTIDSRPKKSGELMIRVLARKSPHPDQEYQVVLLLGERHVMEAEALAPGLPVFDLFNDFAVESYGGSIVKSLLKGDDLSDGDAKLLEELETLTEGIQQLMSMRHEDRENSNSTLTTGLIDVLVEKLGKNRTRKLLTHGKVAWNGKNVSHLERGHKPTKEERELISKLAYHLRPIVFFKNAFWNTALIGGLLTWWNGSWKIGVATAVVCAACSRLRSVCLASLNDDQAVGEKLDPNILTIARNPTMAHNIHRHLDKLPSCSALVALMGRAHADKSVFESRHPDIADLLLADGFQEVSLAAGQ